MSETIPLFLCGAVWGRKPWFCGSCSADAQARSHRQGVHPRVIQLFSRSWQRKWNLSFAANDGGALNLDQDARSGKAADCDERARWEALLENLPADLCEAVAKPNVVDENGHRNHVFEPAATDCPNSLVN